MNNLVNEIPDFFFFFFTESNVLRRCRVWCDADSRQILKQSECRTTVLLYSSIRWGNGYDCGWLIGCNLMPSCNIVRISVATDLTANWIFIQLRNNEQLFALTKQKRKKEHNNNKNANKIVAHILWCTTIGLCVIKWDWSRIVSEDCFFTAKRTHWCRAAGGAQSECNTQRDCVLVNDAGNGTRMTQIIRYACSSHAFSFILSINLPPFSLYITHLKYSNPWSYSKAISYDR